MKSLAIPLLLALATVPAHAAWSLLADFDSGYTAAALDGQNGWVSQNGTVTADPLNPLNQVASFNVAVAGSHLALPGGGIADGGVGSLFFRAMFTSANPNFNIGGSHLANPNGAANVFDSFKSQLRFGASGAPNANVISIRDGGAFANTPATFATDTWYNVWLVVDNASDSTAFYVSTDIDPGAPIATGAFRGGATTDPILNFYFRTNSDSAGLTFLDDIYFDGSGANLSYAIPEPSGSLLAALGALGLLRRRRA